MRVLAKSEIVKGSQKFAAELTSFDMDVSDIAPGASSDRDEVTFRLSGRTHGAACVITRQALEDHSWLPLLKVAVELLICQMPRHLSPGR
jgi:hypothetical protein